MTSSDPVEWAVAHARAALIARPGPEIHAAVGRCLLDWIGCAWAGSLAASSRAVARAAVTLGNGRCSAAGLGRGASPFAAALVNGTASHALDYDDTEMTFVGHPGVVIIPAVLAVGEDRRLSWAAFDAAVAFGYQLTALLGRAAQPAHQNRGWHTTSTLGTLAAAGAAAHAIRPDAELIAHAMRLGATQAAGVIGAFGSDAKAFQAGRAAAAGVLSAELAVSGLGVSPQAVIGTSGYAAASTGDWHTPARPDLSPVVAGPTVKLHAACRSTHCTIDAVHRLRADGWDAARIAALRVRVAPRSFQAAGVAEPATAYAAKFSIRHAAALALAHDAIDETVFVDGVWDAPAVLALRSRIRVEIDDALAMRDEPAVVVAIDDAGHRAEVRIDSPVGGPDRPLSMQQLLTKFARLVACVPGGAERAAAVRDAALERPPHDVVTAARLLPRANTR